MAGFRPARANRPQSADALLPIPSTTHPTKQPHVFRLHRSRVYYVRESLLRQAISVPRANLISLGVCLGKFSKTEKFRLHVTALDLMGKYAKNKVRALQCLPPGLGREIRVMVCASAVDSG